MRKQYVRKIAIFLTAAMLLTACGNGQAGGDPANGGAPDGSSAVIGEPIPSVSPSSSESQSLSQPQSSSESQPLSESPDESEAGEDPSASPEKTASIDGKVKSLGDGSFVISQLFNETDDAGGEVLVYNQEEETLVTVYYTDSTSFIIRTSTDGLTSTDSAATSSDIAPGKSVILEGRWDGSDFHADKVSIWNIQIAQ